jgi:hypothetical protein
MTTPKDEAHEQLRAWARGLYPLEAATELLIRAFNGRFTEPGWPWIHPTVHGQWIDFSTIREQIAGLSGGEQRLLRIAASIGSTDATVNLSDCLTGLDRPSLQLVLAAIAHAAGSHEDREVIRPPNGTLALTTPGPAHPWTGAASTASETSSSNAPRRSL